MESTLPGTPFRHPHSEQRRPARAHAVGPVLGPHARTDRTRNTRVAVPRLPAPEDGRSGEGQCLTQDVPHNGGRPAPPGDGPPPPPRHAAPTGRAGQGDSVGTPHPHARTHSNWVADPNSPPSRRAVGGGGVPDLRRPSGQWKAPPPPPRARPSATPTASNAGPQGRTLWGRCWVPTPAPTAPGTHWSRDPGRPPQRTGGRGRDSAWHQTPLTTVAGRPPGDGSPPPPRHAAPTGHAGQRGGDGPPHPHARAHSIWVTDPNSPPSGSAVGGRGSARPQTPPQRWKTAPPGTPFCQPHSEQRRPARAHAVGPVLGPHARTNRTRNTRVAVARLPAPEDERSGEGQRLTPDAPQNSDRPPPPGEGPQPPPQHAAPTGRAGHAR